MQGGSCLKRSIYKNQYTTHIGDKQNGFIYLYWKFFLYILYFIHSLSIHTKRETFLFQIFITNINRLKNTPVCIYNPTRLLLELMHLSMLVAFIRLVVFNTFFYHYNIINILHLSISLKIQTYSFMLLIIIMLICNFETCLLKLLIKLNKY